MSARRITWAWDPDSGIDRLDKDYGCDAMVDTGRRLVALAVRLRGAQFRRFGDITLRHLSLQTPGKMLESKKAIARFMFYGWCDTDRPTPPSSLVDWYIVWLQRLLDRWNQGRLSPRLQANHDPSSTFAAFRVADLSAAGLVLCGNDRPPPAPAHLTGPAADAHRAWFEALRTG